MDSILTSVKRLLGIEEEYTQFDQEIIMHINAVFMILRQMGIGPKEGFLIESDSETWSDFDENIQKVAGVKTYVSMKVRLMFDPPSGSAMEAINALVSEYEWRLSSAANYTEEN